MKTRILWIGVLTAILSLGAGLIINPSFVARNLSRDGILERETISSILSFQLLAASLGFLFLIVAVWIYNRRWGYMLLAPCLVAYFLVAHAVYITPHFPANTFLQPRTLAKFWDVLLGKNLFLSDFEPKPLLVTEKHQVMRAKYPVINVHVHFTYWIEKIKPEEMIKIMDNCGVDQVVDLDGVGKMFDEKIALYTDKYRDRFIMFYHIWFPEGPITESFVPQSVADLENAVKRGARGLKIWRNLGLTTTDESENVIPVDDPRWDPIWTKAGDLGIPVLIHVAERNAQFLPVDRFNELYEMLRFNPLWSYDSTYPRKAKILEQFSNVVGKHTKTIFIGAHMAMMAEDLEYVGSLLDKHSNLYLEFGAQIPELGRKPYSSRSFFIKYQDRILFGTDGNPREDAYRAHFRFLETADEYFDYPFAEVHSFGRWKIYGLYLPDEVLAKIYYKNAEKIILHQ